MLTTINFRCSESERNSMVLNQTTLQESDADEIDVQPTQDEQQVLYQGRSTRREHRVVLMDDGMDDSAAILSHKQQRLNTATSEATSLPTSPIFELQDDVMGMIFQYCLPQGGYYSTTQTSEAPIILTHVSSGFRHLALSMPLLWSSIRVIVERDDLQSEWKIPTRVLEWLRLRTGRVPLRLSVSWPDRWPDKYAECPSNELCSQMQEVLTLYASRWIELEFNVTTFIDYVLPTNHPHESQFLNLQHFSCITDNIRVPSELWSSTQALATPTLRKLELSRYTGKLTDFKVLWSNLTELCYKYHFVTEANSIAEALNQAQNLINCTIHVGYTSDSNIERISNISLPVLRTLEIDEWDLPEGETGVFGRIFAPQVENLTLRTQINFITLINLLKCYPMVSTLKLLGRGEPTPGEATDLLEALMMPDPGGHLCPSLQDFHCDALLPVSGDMVRRFLICDVNNVAHWSRSWKQVIISISFDTLDQKDFDNILLELTKQDFKYIRHDTSEVDCFMFQVSRK